LHIDNIDTRKIACIGSAKNLRANTIGFIVRTNTIEKACGI
jgi:hypothetical protein